jgi:ribosomal protein L40E
LSTCEVCGTDNPDEARFCMKCGKDMTAVPAAGGSEAFPEPESFTPAAADGEGRLASTASSRLRMPPAEPVDVDAYKRQATEESIGAFESQAIGEESAGPAEIQHSGVTADFADKRRFCARCGAANPYEQRFCRQCGGTLGAEQPAQPLPAQELPPSIPMAPETFQHTTLADISGAPASDYYTEGLPGSGSRRVSLPSTGISSWGAGEWSILVVVVLLAVGLTWLFAFGGFNMLFSGKTARISKAAGVMESLPSFQYDVSSTMELSEGAQYGGAGRARYESPSKSYWEMGLDAPSNPRVTASMQIEDKVYINGPAWQPGDPEQASADITDLWRHVETVEYLGTQPIGTSNCYHYKYRVPPTLVTTVLGVGAQSGASDAVVEAWIDTVSMQIVKISVQVFNVQIDGAATKVTMGLGLSATGQPYNITAPQLGAAPQQQ